MSQPTIWIEKFDVHAAGPMSNKADKLVEAAPAQFEKLGQVLAAAADRFWAGIQSTQHPPSEVEMELNIAVEAGGDWLIVSGKASASASVKLVWKKG